MDNLFVWLIIGPIIYSWQLAGPLLGLLATGYIRVIFGFRIWATLLVSFLISFVYYLIAIPADGWLGTLWTIKVAMAFHTAWNVTLILWLIDKIIQARNHASP